ncbi:ATP-dependent DNA helicase [Aphis craccivora]|uniref:ATP-dependent DNA helicase n=1 Tax=Aphis craccivora TaxID=307492 RepID=A0A6G0Y845_APHCR|nr:ATP-dependent DNA helicase [Aphis craccivora]
MLIDFIIDYKNDPVVSLGAMSIVCQYCLALKRQVIILNMDNSSLEMMPTFKGRLAVYYRIDMTNTYFCRYTLEQWSSIFLDLRPTSLEDLSRPNFKAYATQKWVATHRLKTTALEYRSLSRRSYNNKMVNT